MMSLILKNQHGVQCYLNDIIVFGNTSEESDNNLHSVLNCISKTGLKLNRSKCKFRQTELSFLGHTISQAGLKPDLDHILAISNAPPPTDLQTLRSFLGLTSRYAKFIPNYASVIEPLRELLQRSSNLVWTTDAQASFEMVKDLIVHSPVRVLFSPALPTIVTTEASNYGLGAVLTQLHEDNIERTVAFASRTLSNAERKYSTVKKETLACVWATEKWRTYPWGRTLELCTDHSPLTTLLTTKGLGRAEYHIARWSARLLSFNEDLEYKPGNQNVVADCLSRPPLPSPDGPPEDEDVVVALITSTLTAVTREQFQAACSACPIQQKLWEFLTKRWPSHPKNLDPVSLPYFRVRDELSLLDGCVLRGTHPATCARRITVKTHTPGTRYSSRNCQNQTTTRDLYLWPGMDSQTEALIKSGVTCQLHNKTAVTCTPPLQPVPLPESAWEKVATDIVGPFDTAPSDCHYAITLIDNFSKWPEVVFTSQISSATVIKFLSSVFSREGNPKELVSDNDSQFTSLEFETFLARRNILRRRSSLYYPQANGEIEPFNGSLKESLQTVKLEG
ncbi:unnamed protein product [Natator depressus]